VKNNVKNCVITVRGSDDNAIFSFVNKLGLLFLCHTIIYE